jgi:hypothetical protein
MAGVAWAINTLLLALIILLKRKDDSRHHRRKKHQHGLNEICTQELKPDPTEDGVE